MLAENSLEGRAEKFLGRIEHLIAEGESAKGTYMNECKARREDIKTVYNEAKDAGVPMKALKGIVKKRQLDRKVAEIAAGMDIDESAAYATLCEALGPLGAAAAAAAGHAPEANGRADEVALDRVGRGKH